MRRVYTLHYEQRFHRLGWKKYEDTTLAKDVSEACEKLRRKAFREEIDGNACTHVRITEVHSGPEVTM